MNARIAQIARNLRRKYSPAVATPPPSDAEISAAPVGDAHTASHQLWSFPLVLPQPLRSPPLVQRVRVERSRSFMLLVNKQVQEMQAKERIVAKAKVLASLANIRASDQSAVQPKDAAEDEENTKHLKDLVAWWKQAREELKTPSNKVAEMEGDKLNPDWAISARSSMLRTHVGQDSFKLYKACCLERDQVLLAQTANTRVEEHLAHVLMQASTFGHNLSLKCLMFRYDKAGAEQKIRDLQQSLDQAQAKEKDALEAKAKADA
ncbi:hypothetical protein Salat_2414500 [Sesamum alatum]|uniref:Uncharacterized protein n=1 Tax=Sesamum alatum TaxID=300844 RepID=A0AAE1XYQ3_9LAMI|nr:hypothetical protein Salat_2414500 [Sesamum alatum]